MALVAVAALLALQLLPALLKPPEPPPLAADVGLPRVSRSSRSRQLSAERRQPTPTGAQRLAGRRGSARRPDRLQAQSRA